MKKNKIAHYFIILAFVLSFFGFTKTNAATLQINSNSATLSPGGIMTLVVVLNSEGIAINNAEAKIIFPADLLEVISINKSSSIFSLWVEEPSYSNSTGIITFNGGIPTPGFTGSSGVAISIVVKAKTAGQVDLIFSEAAVRANDGLGTDVLNSKRGKTITIVKKENPVVEDVPVSPTPASASSNIALQVTSPTHPSQEAWYKDTSSLFRWKIPTGVDAIQTGIDNNTSGSPRVTYSPVIDEKSVKDLEDGIWYFKVRARKSGVWGPVSTYVVRVDSTIPVNNKVSFSFDDTKKILYINADILDETSGLDYYEIYINDLLTKKVPASEFINGNYALSVNTPGNNTIKLVAVDRAGNSIESLGTFQATFIPEEIQVVPNANKHFLVSIGSFSTSVVYFIITILLIALLLVFGGFKLGRHYSKIRSRLKVSTALSKGDNLKVLSSLKRHLEKHLKILQNIRHDRVLSKEEKEIKEAIESDLDEVDKAIENEKVEK